MEETRKRKRVSKNKKKSWRKHTDIHDVEEYLEDRRLEERTGGIIADKPDNELFVVDTVTEVVQEDEAAGIPTKRRKKQMKALRCHALLKPDGKIKPVTGVPRKSEKKKSLAVRQKIENGALSNKEKKALEDSKKSVELSRMRRKNHNAVQEAAFDLWADDTSNKGLDSYYLKITKKERIKAPKHLSNKPSKVPAVEVIHPGASYNPTYEDHQELMRQAHEVEVEKLKKEEKLERKVQTEKVTAVEAETNWLKEMSAGLADSDSEDESESDENDEESDADEGSDEGSDEESDEDRISVNPPVRREDKKTEKQRKKEQQQKEKKKAEQVDKIAKEKQNQFYRLRSIKKEINMKDKDLKERSERKALKKKLNEDKPKQLGRLKYEDPEIPIKLSDELQGSLRLLKPEGHLLEDRFKSYQKRNIIEPRKRAKFVRKYKVKYAEKKGHKEITL